MRNLKLSNILPSIVIAPADPISYPSQIILVSRMIVFNEDNKFLEQFKTFQVEDETIEVNFIKYNVYLISIVLLVVAFDLYVCSAIHFVIFYYNIRGFWRSQEGEISFLLGVCTGFEQSKFYYPLKSSLH